MAYNTKYILNYCNRDGDKLTIELQVDGYVGQAFIIVNNEDYLQDDRGRFVTVNVDGSYDPDRDKNKIEGSANPFSLTYRNDRGEKGGAIRATSATMEFFEDMVFNIDDLATSDETELRCVFKYNDVIEWIGFVTPDFFNVEITSNPVISLTASDRIGILKDVNYAVSTSITDKTSILEILASCLYETGLDLNINIVCDMFCDQFTDNTVNAFESSFVAEWRVYKDIEKEDLEKCYTILQAIMDQYNCLLTQYKGEWWIVNKYNLEKGTGTLWKYTYQGVYISKSPISFSETHFSLIDTGGERTIIPAGAKNTYLLNHGSDLLYPLNYNFNIFNGNNPEYWDINGLGFDKTKLIPISYHPSNGWINDYYQDDTDHILVTESYTGNLSAAHILVRFNQTNITSKHFPVRASGGKALDFSLTIKSVGRPKTGLMIGWFIYFPNSDLLFSYSTLDNNGKDGEVWYCYKYSDINNSSATVLIPPLVFPDKYNDATIANDIEFKLSRITSISALKSLASIQTPSLTLSDDDFNEAECFVRIYPNVREDSIEAFSAITETKVDFKNDNQVPKGTVFQTTLEGRFTKPTEKRDVMWGDYQTFGQNGYFYKYREDSLSIIYNSDGQMTKDWYTPWDSTRQPLLLHSLRQLTKTYARAHDELRIGFDLNRIDPFSHFAIRCVTEKYVQVNSDNDYLQEGQGKYITANIGKYLNNKRFILVEGTIDYLRSSFSGVLAEIVNTEKETKEYIYSYFEDSNIK